MNYINLTFLLRRRRREREAVAYREHERYNAHPACRRPFKSGPQQPNALTAMHPLTEPIPPMSEQEEDYDKPYYANGTVPSWMGYRPLPVPTYEDIMFTQVKKSLVFRSLCINAAGEIQRDH